MAFPRWEGGIPFGRVKLYVYVLLSPAANRKSTKRIDCGVDSMGIDFEPIFGQHLRSRDN
jgi:hypothetical protein